MAHKRCFGWALAGLVLGLIVPEAYAGDSEPEKLLKEKGLSKTHSTWVIKDEEPVLASYKEARAVFQSYAQVAERLAEADQLVEQSKMLEAQRAQLQSNLNTVNQEISRLPRASGRAGRFTQQMNSQSPLYAQKAELTAELSQVNQTQSMIKPQLLNDQAKNSLKADVAKRQEAFKTTLEDLRKQIDGVTKKYDELGADTSVKKAITDLSASAHAKVKLGPSDAFATMLKEVESAERRYLGKTTPAASKKKSTRGSSKKSTSQSS